MQIHAIPQRSGALTPSADRLPHGCRALAALAGELLDVPVRECALVHDGTSTVDGVANSEALLRNQAAQRAMLRDVDEPVLTIGGDCAIDLVPVGRARGRYGAGLAVAWFDAHADLNTEVTSPSGAFHGMVLRSLFGQGAPEFAANPALEPGMATLIGARAFDPAETDAIEAGLAGHLPVAQARDPAKVAAGVRAMGGTALYVHVDLDVLDPREFDGMDYPEDDGLTVAELAEGLRSLREFDVAGVAITECVSDDRPALEVLAPVLTEAAALLGK